MKIYLKFYTRFYYSFYLTNEIISLAVELSNFPLLLSQTKSKTQDEDQGSLLKKRQLEIEELQEVVTGLTQDEYRRLLLRERQLAIEERERERIELIKLKKELNIK